ncbi:magnesium/cobalt transporter CorA [Candidatus Woesearchaeota archaeon]|nr:magnesium/cobalt transporter CorA [Candidatus Woesearchaeota archaeon]
MIDAYYFDKSVKRVNVADLRKLRSRKLWVDITNITKKEAELVRETFGLHPLTIEDFSKTHTRVKVEEFPNYLFCVFYGIRGTSELVELDFVLGRNFIISNHFGEIPAYNGLKSNRERLGRLFREGNDFIFHYLLDTQVDNYFPILDAIDDEIEELEEKVVRSADPAIMRKILELKKSVLLIKRAALPAREKLSYLLLNKSSLISDKAIPYFRDIYDHSIRVCDAVDTNREAISGAFEFYMSAVNNSTNEIMKMLSIVATIALPLTVISSIYGTNFRFIPGAENPLGFWFMVVMMVVISATMFRYFWKRGWIRLVR